MTTLRIRTRPALCILALGLMAGACSAPPTYDRDDPAASLEAMNAELAPGEQQALAQAVGTLVGSFAAQAMMGAEPSEMDPVLEERLDRMDGMTAQEIIAYAAEVREAESAP